MKRATSKKKPSLKIAQEGKTIQELMDAAKKRGIPLGPMPGGRGPQLPKLPKA